MSNCNPKYKNLNRVQSFSEQRYATVQLFEQICQNDEYLKQKVEELDYLTPPAVRKRFNPIPVDRDVSYSFLETTDNNVIFDTSSQSTVSIDFSDMSVIDSDMSTAVIESYEDNGVIVHQAVVPHTLGEVDKTVKNWATGQINSFWYVGYDKNQTYQVRPSWLQDWRESDIPAVCRAQTFTVPSGKGGKLEAISLQIENNGTTSASWGSPLIVQIWPTKNKTFQKMTWDPKTRTNVPATGTETVPVPAGDIYNPLAEATYDPKRTQPGFVSIVFDQPATLVAGESYAIVMFSPLSNWNHCPRIGGWGRNCANSKYMGGDAFFSNNNGRTWERYGRNDLKVEYRLGQLTPSDFAFQANIRLDPSTRSTDTHYLYLKPILTNPFKKVVFSCNDSGDSASFAGKLEYQVSTDGRTWSALENHEKSFSPVDGEYPRILFVRVKMWTTNNGVTPVVQDMNIYFTNVLPNKMYVRTHFFTPKLSPMLGATHWGRIYAPVNMDPSTDCKVEVIQEKEVTEHFQIITAEELSEYTFIEGLDEEKITDDDLDVRYGYLIDDPTAIELLRENNVYVKPWTDDEEVEHGLSFYTIDEEENRIDIPFYLKNSPAYPIIECQIQPAGDEGVCNYGEWYDFNVDYDNDTITLAEDLINDVPVGSITFTYNPIFIQDLTQSEIGRTYNGVNSSYTSNPLVIDYFKQEFIVSDDILESRQVPLRASPVDPLRSVILNKNTDDERELIEDNDFVVDYTKGMLIFNIVDEEDYSTILNLNDKLEVIYTPNLEDTGIALGYVCTREGNTDKQVKILPNWVEYKV